MFVFFHNNFTMVVLSTRSDRQGWNENQSIRTHKNNLTGQRHLKINVAGGEKGGSKISRGCKATERANFKRKDEVESTLIA